MHAYFVSFLFLHLHLCGEDVNDGIQCLNPGDDRQ